MAILVMTLLLGATVTIIIIILVRTMISISYALEKLLYVDMCHSHVNAYVYNVIYLLFSEGYRASREVVKN